MAKGKEQVAMHGHLAFFQYSFPDLSKSFKKNLSNLCNIGPSVYWSRVCRERGDEYLTREKLMMKINDDQAEKQTYLLVLGTSGHLCKSKYVRQVCTFKS